MTARKAASAANVNRSRKPGGSSWGVQDPGKRQVRLPSGSKLKFTEEDQEAFLQFLGKKDISERVIDVETGEHQPEGTVIYSVFHDGKRIVNIADGYAMSEFKFESGGFYYVHVAGFVDTSQPTPMKDLDIYFLGQEGEKGNVDEEYIGQPTIDLTLKEIGKFNYEFLNYPLRKV